MDKLSTNLKKFLNNQSYWIISTCSNDIPNCAPIFFKKIDENGNLVLFDVFMNKTLKNIAENNNVAISVFDSQTFEGYQLKGIATYSDSEEFILEGNRLAKQNNIPLTIKGAVIINWSEIYIQTSGSI